MTGLWTPTSGGNMTTLEKANWLVENGYFDNMIYFMSDGEIDAIFLDACCQEVPVGDQH
jgi:hypothetical protein